MTQSPATTTVEGCMGSPVVTVTTTTTLEGAASRMTEENIKKSPVVAEEGDRIEGIITTTDIEKYLPVQEFHPEE